jgi:hypothetical protein
MVNIHKDNKKRSLKERIEQDKFYKNDIHTSRKNSNSSFSKKRSNK